MLKRLARWVLRRELAELEWALGAWKQWALVQERYRREVHGEQTSLHERFATWFSKTYPTKDGQWEYHDER